VHSHAGCHLSSLHLYKCLPRRHDRVTLVSDGCRYQISMTNCGPHLKRFHGSGSPLCTSHVQCSTNRFDILLALYFALVGRTQPAARAYHTHCFWRPPHPRSYRCFRRVPIQASAALLQLCQPCQCSHQSSRSLHTTQKLQGYPLIGLLVVTFKVSPQLSCVCIILKSLLLAPLVFCRSRDHSNRWPCCTYIYPSSFGKKPRVAEAPQEN
jgi:hypothetical protein